VTSEDQFIAAVNDAVEHAAYLLELGDVPDDAEEGFRDMIWADRYHCGVCTANTVMDVVWDPIARYIDHVRCRRFSDG
jgi:hypothetical protein